jgi:hypothetical protein
MDNEATEIVANLFSAYSAVSAAAFGSFFTTRIATDCSTASTDVPMEVATTYASAAIEQTGFLLHNFQALDNRLRNRRC